MSTVTQKFYIFDSSAGIVAVYNADTLVREKDILLQNPPQALALDAGGGSLLLGYPKATKPVVKYVATFRTLTGQL